MTVNRANYHSPRREQAAAARILNHATTNAKRPRQERQNSHF